MAVGCGPSVVDTGSSGAAEGTGDVEADPATGSETGSGEDPDPSGETSGGGGSETGEVETCPPLESLSGAIAWSTIGDGASASEVVLDPLSDAFYLSSQDCIGRRGADGNEEAVLSGTGCSQLAIAPTGELVVAGTVTVPSTEDFSYARVSKLHPDGGEVWSHVRDAPGVREAVTDVAVDGSGNTVVVGYDILDEGPRSWILEFDEVGRSLWSVEREASWDATPRVGIDGTGHIVLGETFFDGTDAFVRLARLAPDGTQLWAVDTMGPADSEFTLDAMGVGSDGSILVAGENRVGTFETYESLTMFDAQGEQLWSHAANDTPWVEHTEAIAFGPCGTVVVAGTGDEGDGTWGNIWIAKLSEAGEPVWSHQIDGGYSSGSFGEGDDRIHSIAVDDQGGVTATGWITVDKELRGDVVMDIRERWLARFEP